MKKRRVDEKRIGRLPISILVAMVMTLTVFSAKIHADATVGSWQKLKEAINNGGTQTITLSSDFEYNGESIKIPSGANITITGDKTIYSTESPEGGKYESMFVLDGGGSLTIDEGVTLSAKIGQVCPDGSQYTSDTFTGDIVGNDYEPKGFFIQVSDGTATLKGTLSDFVTSTKKEDTPRYVAPVVANGAAATFNIEGGTIKNNLVGYIVDNSKANTNAQTIKQYVKGQGPNVPRVPNAVTQKANKSTFERPRQRDAGIDGGSPGSGLTGTAGAVIYKGGARGEIQNGANITNNRADTGGVMVSGDGTEVAIGSDTNADDTTTLSKNVGVQFGGGSTTEQGGLITMRNGLFTENVAWFGGGAVYATENGIAWLMGLMNGPDGLNPQFDNRLDGKFEMFGGKLDGNTSLTRGGAVLADSDGVQIVRGKLTNNMSRMLGGAVYVMGDHPKYTYTMHLEGLYVHDNTAVSGVTPGAKSAENDKLQTALSAPTACADSDALFSGRLSKNTDDMADGPGTHGTGGGVWLCAYGNTMLAAGSTDKVVIANNYATGVSPLSNPVYSNYQRYSSDPAAVRTRADINYNSGNSSISHSGKTGGSDIHADTGDEGTVIIDGLNKYPGWYDENTNGRYTTEVSDGRINLVNKGNATSLNNPAVEVSGNIARRGGGLAADGTYVLGPAGDQATIGASMKVAKQWSAGAEKQPVMMRVTAKAGSKTAHVADVPLDGVANPPANEFDTVQELEPSLNTWNGQFNLPLTLTATDNSKLAVFTFHLDYTTTDDEGEPLVFNKDIDPLSFSGRKDLANLISKIKRDNTDQGVVDKDAVIAALKDAIKISFNNNLEFECKEYEMEQVTDPATGAQTWEIKTDENGNPKEVTSYIFTKKDVDLSKVDFDVTSTPNYEKVWNPDTQQYEDREVFQIHLLGVNLVLPVSNDNKPVTEKYVNNQVHSDIVNFDQEFKYDIMAYVPLDADGFEITDTLVPGLEFADKDGNRLDTADAAKLRENISVVVKTDNDHEPNGTVALDGLKDHQGNKVIDFTLHNDIVAIEGNKMTVTIDENTVYQGGYNDKYNALETLRGRWVQVTFYARIQDQYRSIEGLKALQNSWANEDSDKRGDPVFDAVFSNGDPILVQTLANEVGPDEIIWAVEAPSRLFAKTASGVYYATPMNDKSGNTWEEIDPEGEDTYFGKNAYINADNRFNGRNPEAANTRRLLDTEGQDKGLVAALKNLPKIKGGTVEKAAEGATRLFAQVKNVDGETEYWATPNNDKSGETWTKLDPDGVGQYGKEAYNSAVGRLKPDKFTIRMLDLDDSKIITLDKDGKNWPVISEEKHEGMKNQGEYRVKFGNDYGSTYKTNTVTVKPETTELEIKKTWSINGKKQWPGNAKVTFGVYAVDKDGNEKTVYTDSEGNFLGAYDAANAPQDASPLRVTLNKDNETETVKNLPRLKGITYTAREIKINDKDVVFDQDTGLAKTEDAITIDGEDKEVLTTDAVKYKGDAEKLQKLHDDNDVNPIRGAVADNRIFAMGLDGKYYVTEEGDTEGNKANTQWTELVKPTAVEENTEPVIDKVKIYRRAQALLGAVGGDGSISEPTADDAEAFPVNEVMYNAFNTVAETEKYVERKVHADIVEFDKEFTYQVMGYVPENATAVELTDTLTKDLEFVNTDVAKVLTAVHIYKTNDHQGDGTGTVSTAGGNNFIRDAAAVASNTRQQSKPVDERDYKIDVTGKTLTLTLKEGFLEEVRNSNKMKNFADKGFWVKMAFKAKINPDSYAELTEKILSGDAETVTDADGLKWEKVTDDGTVENGKDVEQDGSHAGLLNKASYRLTIGNNGKADHDTNTVTIKPETTEINVKKLWNGKNDWPNSNPKVVIGLRSKKTGKASVPVNGSIADTGAGDTRLFTAGGSDQAKYELNTDNRSVTITGLPKLEDANYIAEELSVNGTPVTEGRTVEIDGVVYKSTILFNSSAADGTYETEINNNSIEVEKYVNNDVHAKLVEFDKAFKYDIMAFIDDDATQAIITDKLVGALEFAKAKDSIEAADDSAAEKATAAGETIVSIVAKDSNTHYVTGKGDNGSTVAGTDTGNAGEDVKALATCTIENGNTLKVVFGDGQNKVSDKLRGKWVQITFWAKYTDETIKAAKMQDVKAVQGNGAVLGGVYEHEGTWNQAEYTLKTENNAGVTVKTNIVTVEAETTKVYAQKRWLDESGNDQGDGYWPKKIESIKFNVFRNESGKDPVKVDEIVVNAETKQPVSKDLPKLIGVTYTVDEDTVPPRYEKLDEVEGDGTEGSPFTIKNKAKKYVDKVVTKKWKGATSDKIPSPEDFKSALVLRNSAGTDVTGQYDELLTVTKNGSTYTAKWKDLPDGTYTVDEIELPGFTKSKDGDTITNTKKPSEEKPEIEKYVNQAVHKDINIDEVFTYDVIAYVTKDADTVTITDKLHDMLRFEGGADSVKVVDLGESNNHKVTNNIESKQVNDDATVAEAGKTIDAAKVEIVEGKTLKVSIANKLKPIYAGEKYDRVEDPIGDPSHMGWYEKDGEEYVLSKDTEVDSAKTYYQKDDAVDPEEITGYEYDGEDQPVTALRGHWVKVTFKARIDGKTLAQVKKAYETIKADRVEDRAKDNVGNAPVVSVEDHEGLPNNASYTIGVANEAGIEEDVHKDKSNTVTVKPWDEKPEIEKYINKAVHKDIALKEKFTYDIIAYITKDAESATITDTLNKQLQFVSTASQVKVSDLGTFNNHKVTNNVQAKQVNSDATVSEKGKEITFANVTIGKNPAKLTVKLKDTTGKTTGHDLRGHWVRVTFTCKIKDGLKIKDLKFTKIDPNAKENRAAPNVGNAPVATKEGHQGVPNDASYEINVGGKVKYKDRSNTVTVRPTRKLTGDEDDDETGDDEPKHKKSKKKTGKQVVKTSRTGDDSAIELFVMMMIVATAALIATRRKHSK